MTCTLEYWKREYVMRYDCGGVSSYLNRLCEETGNYYVLLVNYNRPLEAWKGKKAEGKDCREVLKPREYHEVINGWKRGEELTREYCGKDDYCYWVKWPAYLINTGRRYNADYIYIIEWRIDVEKAKKRTLFGCPSLPLIKDICKKLHIPEKVTYYDIVGKIDEAVSNGYVYMHGKVSDLEATVIKKWKLEYPDKLVFIYFLKRQAVRRKAIPIKALLAAIAIAAAAGVLIVGLYTIREGYKATVSANDAYKSAMELGKECIKQGYSTEECAKFVKEISKEFTKTTLEIRPYVQPPSISFTNFLDKYKWYLIAGAAGFIALVSLLKR